MDGNGRTSRLLSTLCLYRAGYDFKRLFTLSEFYDRDRSAFYAALQGVRANDMDLTGWLEFFVHGLSVQMEEIKSRGERVIRCDLLVREHGLNERQARVVELLAGAESLGIENIQTALPRAPRRTLQRDLQVLVEKGIAVAQGAARARRYRLQDKSHDESRHESRQTCAVDRANQTQPDESVHLPQARAGVHVRSPPRP